MKTIANAIGTAATLHLAFTLSIATLRAEDWPQWRGPNRNGISAERGLLKEWPKEGPKQVWQITDAGAGYSTPAVVGDRIFVLGNEGMENEFAQARSAKDGSRLWSTKLGKVGTNKGPQYPATRSTPTVDGELLYALGSDGDLVCLEAASGSLRWQKNLRSDFGGQPGNWAYAESPLVDGDFLICSPGGATATIVALNKKTGDVVWKSAVPGGDEAGYASVINVNSGGVKQYVQFLQKGLVGIDAKTGKFLWRYEQTAKGSAANIPTPIVDQDFIYSAANRTGAGLVKLKNASGTFEAEQIYFTPKLPTAIGGAVKVGEFIYGTTAQGMVCAQFATSDLKWQERALGAASICYADGRLYLHGESGEVGLVEATPEAYREKGRFTPANPPARGQAKAWAYPVVANGKLYIRDVGSIWCYDVKAAH